jgi:Rieske [2Fe-2S] domain
VAFSAEVPVGGVIGSPFLDGRVVIYRTSDGVAHVQSPYCRHLGADLSLGKVDVTGKAADVEKMRAAAREYSLRLVNEDGPIFDTISFRRDCLTPSDRLLGFGTQHITRYPRAHPGREMITK